MAAADDVVGPDDTLLQARLNSSEKLADLDSLLGHSEKEHCRELRCLIQEFPS